MPSCLVFENNGLTGCCVLKRVPSFFSIFQGLRAAQGTGSAKQQSKGSILFLPNLILPCLILLLSNLIFLFIFMLF